MTWRAYNVCFKELDESCDAFVGNTGHSDSEIDLACSESSERTVFVREVQLVLVLRKGVAGCNTL